MPAGRYFDFYDRAGGDRGALPAALGEAAKTGAGRAYDPDPADFADLFAAAVRGAGEDFLKKRV